MLKHISTHVTVEQLSKAAELPFPAGSASCSTTKPFADSGEATNSAIRYAVTVGHRVTAPAIIAQRDISYVMECVKTGFVEGTDIRALIHTIRNLPNEKLAKAMKTGLPWFCGSVCERLRSNSTVKLANFAILDFDHVVDIEVTKQVAIDKLPYVRWAFQSVRDGVKLVIQFDKPVTREEDYRVLWQYLALQAEHALGVKPDATPDWSRACFFSFDPGLLYNSAFKPVNVAQALKEAALVLEIGKNVIPSLTRDPVFKESNDHPTPHPSETVKKEKTGFRLGGRNDKARSLGNNNDAESFERARSVVTQLAQIRTDYLDWIKCGMALYAGFGEGGRELWDIFLDNPHYEETEKDLEHHWRSFRKVHTITIATLFYLGEKYGVA